MALDFAALPPEAVKAWNGSTWVTVPVKVGNGTSFVTPGTFPIRIGAETAPPPVIEPDPGEPPSANALTWAPPTGWTNYPTRNVQATTGYQVISGNGGDVRLIMPNSVIGPMTIENYRNVVLIGGASKALGVSRVDGYDQRLIYVRDCTGTVHIEGWAGDGSTPNAETDGITANHDSMTLQVQNCRVTGLDGLQSTNHADVIQTWRGLKELRVDGLTGDSDYQGIKFQLVAGEGYMGPVTLKRTNLRALGSGARYLYWMDPNTPNPIVLEDVWIQWYGSRGLGQSVWPGITNGTNPAQIDSEGRAYWPTMPNVTGRINPGAPPSGDFVPAGAAGLGYVSPGYVT